MYCVMLCCAVLCCIVSCRVVSCCDMLCHVVLCCVGLCCALHCVTITLHGIVFYCTGIRTVNNDKPALNGAVLAMSILET